MKKYVEIDKKLAILNLKKPFGPVLDQLIQDQLMLQWTYNSNAIEGNTLTYKETSFYLLRGLTAKGKSLEEHLEISNHRDAITFLEEILKDKKFKLTEKLIREIHKILFKGIEYIKIGIPGRENLVPINAGSYKSADNHVLKADGTIHYYAPAVGVSGEMEKLISFWEKYYKKLHSIEMAANIHYEINRIHPFTDGNGRVARLVMNLVLLQNGYPPVIIKNEEKEKYYDSLEKADNGNLKPFIQIIKTEVLKTINFILRILEGKGPSTQKKHPLYFIRKEKKLSQKMLSILSGVEQSTISKIENCKESPQEKTLMILAKALKIDPISLKKIS